MFQWDKFYNLCVEHGVKPNTIGKELGITSGTITGWKKGAIPNAEALLKITQRLDTTAEYLLTDDEIFIKPSQKKNAFRHLQALPQRWFSLRHGEPLNDADIISITRFVNCSFGFLYSLEKTEYVPECSRDNDTVLPMDTYEKILSLMDRCVDSLDEWKFQVQLSHIVRYWLEKAGIDYYELAKSNNREKYRSIRIDKLDFIYHNVTHIDKTIDYGFNLTELDAIREATGIPIIYMFTGLGYNQNTPEESKKASIFFE